jgi:hypothetical protein
MNNLRAAAVDLDDLGMCDVGPVGDVQVAVDRVERDILGIVVQAVMSQRRQQPT